MNARQTLNGLFTKSFEKPSDLLCCAFGLRDSEIDTYFALMTGPKTVESITSRIGRDRSTVQRVLKKLHEKGLVERETSYLKRGGYYYTYRALSSENVRTQLLEQLDHWYHETRRFLLDSWPDQEE